jgi:hypothetical protein
MIVLALVAGFGSAALADVDLTKLPPASKQPGVTYEKDIRPILSASCFRCHGEQRPKAGLRLDSLEAALKGSKEGKVITPGKSETSKLVVAVARLDPESAMPPAQRQRGPRSGGPGGQGGAPGEAGASAHGEGSQPPQAGGQGAPGGAGGPRGPMGPPPKPLTSEQVGLIRAWIDQGAK